MSTWDAPVAKRRAEAYAAKFVNDSDAEPTDTEMAAVFAHCVRPASMTLYPLIRMQVTRLRQIRAMERATNA